MCKDLFRKSVSRSVELLKCMMVDPWIHGILILSIDQIDIDQRWRDLLELIPRITSVAGARVASGDVALWALASLPGPLVSYVHILHHFCQVSHIQINLQAQVELGEL